MMNYKPFWKSKTVWVAAAAIAVAGLEHFTEVIPPDANPVILAVVGVVMAYLRTISRTPITKDTVSS
jgi:hypothetical protein